MEISDFNQIYKEMQPNVYYRMYIGVSDEEIANDLTAEVFEKVYKHLKQYDITKAKLITWVTTIAKNHLIDYYRSTLGRTQMASFNVGHFSDSRNDEYGKNYTTDEFFVSEINTSALIENEELSNVLQKAFESLKPTYRKVAELFFKSELSYKEIAIELDLPLNSVKVNIMRAKQMLQNALQPTMQSIM